MTLESILYREIDIPTGGILAVRRIDPIGNGRTLRVSLGSPADSELFLADGEGISGPYRSGDRADTGIGRFASIFSCAETCALGVYTGLWNFPVELPLSNRVCVLPDGQQTSAHLSAQAELSVRVIHSRQLVEQYWSGAVALPVENMIDQALRQAVFGCERRLNDWFPACSPVQALAQLPALSSQLSEEIEGILTDKFRWLEASCHLQIQCTNESQLLEQANVTWNDEREYRKDQARLLAEILRTVYGRQPISAAATKIIASYAKNNPCLPSSDYFHFIQEMYRMETESGTQQLERAFKQLTSSPQTKGLLP